MISIKEKSLGIILCLFIAIPAWLVGEYFPIVGSPVFAILFGMLVGLIYTNREKTSSGITFTSKYILQLAVVLLGFGLNLSKVLKVGLTSLPIIISTISIALLTAYTLQKLLKIDVNTAVLVGVGSSICGGSAIAATAPVIDAKEEEVAKAISVIFLFNILAALIFPTFGQMIGLSNEGFAIFAGTAVNDTSSVTATASAWDSLHHSHALEGATIVKLTRTLAIIPITLCLSLYRVHQSKKNEAGQNFSFKKVFPMFILYFILASVITSVFSSLGSNLVIFSYLKYFSKFFIVMAMAAIGLNTNPIKLIKTGGQAIIVGGTCWTMITVVSLVMQYLLRLW